MSEKGQEAFEIFSSFVSLPSCSIVQTLEYDVRCDYVRSLDECRGRKFFFNYLNFLYCYLKPNSSIAVCLCVAALLCLCIIFFLVVGITADKMFCPALTVISRIIGMNEHLAGVTLLAFGNSAPDLFTSLVGIADQSRLQYSDLFGAAIYVTSFVVGMVCLFRPFKFMPNNILRDVLFLILSVLYIDYIMVNDGFVTITEGVSVISIYIIFMFVTIFDQYLMKKSVKRLEQEIQRKSTAGETPLSTADDLKRLEQLRNEAEIDVVSRVSRKSINVEFTRRKTYSPEATKNDRLFAQFLETLNPIDLNHWREGGPFSRTVIIVLAPIKFCLTLVIPIIDYELDRHGWSKLLNTVQIVILPFVTAVVLAHEMAFFGIRLFVYVLVATIPFAIAVFFTTRTDIPPKFHWVWAILASAGSMMSIYSAASETCEILNVLGIVTFRSTAFLGCTILAWGNGIGDLVANVQLSRAGYQKMGLAACYGGPLFNCVLSMGITFLYKAYIGDDGKTVITRGALGENCLIFLQIILFVTIVWATFTNFFARPSIGIFCIILYCIFFLYTLLVELEVIESYASEEYSRLV